MQRGANGYNLQHVVIFVLVLSHAYSSCKISVKLNLKCIAYYVMDLSDLEYGSLHISKSAHAVST